MKTLENRRIAITPILLLGSILFVTSAVPWVLAQSDESVYEKNGSASQFEATLVVKKIDGCVQTLEAYSGNGVRSVVENIEVRVQLELKMKNIGSRSLIVSRAPRIAEQRLSEKIKLNGVSRQVSSDSLYISPLRYSSKDLEAPLPTLFGIVDKGDSIEFALNTVYILDVKDWKSLLNGVDAEYKIVLWLDQDHSGLTMRERWKDIGFLLFNDLDVGPVALKLRFARRPSRCTGDPE